VKIAARLQRLALGLAAALAFSAGASAAPPDRRDQDADPSQRVLVMLRLPPEHFRPEADYGGGYGDGAGRSARRRLASQLASQNGLLLVDEWPMPLVGVDCFVLAVPQGRSPSDVAQRLSREPQVAWSEPMSLYRGESAPASHNDPLYLAQPAAREWRLAALHQVSTGRGVRVAVIDSAVEVRHPDLIGQVAVSQDFVATPASGPEQHGTSVAGLIAAVADNHLGIAGIAPHARLLALRACWQQPSTPGKPAPTLCDSLSLAKALEFAIDHDAQVINLSLGGPPDALLGKLIDVAGARRIVVVAAFDPTLPGGGFPASHPGVIAVSDESWGPPPPGVYSAPGQDVPTTTPGGHWALVNGSSFAAAHVSGLYALLRERTPHSPTPLKLAAARGDVVDACASLLGPAQVCEGAAADIREAAAAARR
jgi:hypothetical protein